jgi:hypothetical protein
LNLLADPAYRAEIESWAGMKQPPGRKLESGLSVYEQVGGFIWFVVIVVGHGSPQNA